MNRQQSRDLLEICFRDSLHLPPGRSTREYSYLIRFTSNATCHPAYTVRYGAKEQHTAIKKTVAKALRFQPVRSQSTPEPADHLHPHPYSSSLHVLIPTHHDGFELEHQGRLVPRSATAVQGASGTFVADVSERRSEERQGGES